MVGRRWCCDDSFYSSGWIFSRSIRTYISSVFSTTTSVSSPIRSGFHFSFCSLLISVVALPRRKFRHYFCTERRHWMVVNWCVTEMSLVNGLDCLVGRWSDVNNVLKRLNAHKNDGVLVRMSWYHFHCGPEWKHTHMWNGTISHIFGFRIVATIQDTWGEKSCKLFFPPRPRPPTRRTTEAHSKGLFSFYSTTKRPHATDSICFLRSSWCPQSSHQTLLLSCS